MIDLKHTTPKTIIWVDLEMTGLDTTTDRITEVAVIVTDWAFNELASFESGVGQPQAVLKNRMAKSPFWQQHPQAAQEMLQLSLDSPAQDKVQAEVLQLINDHVGPNQVALLAGNSIHTDRGFIRHWWPQVEQRLHYRMLDVTAWKVVMQGKYGVDFTKKEAHRALDDIRESIDELKFYLQKLNVK